MTDTKYEEPATADELAELAKRFQELYAKKRRSFKKADVGKYVAINLDTGEHFIAATAVAALQLAEQKYGNTDLCWTRRIGAL